VFIKEYGCVSISFAQGVGAVGVVVVVLDLSNKGSQSPEFGRTGITSAKVTVGR
jgi:hypothetical protein